MWFLSHRQSRRMSTISSRLSIYDVLQMTSNFCQTRCHSSSTVLQSRYQIRMSLSTSLSQFGLIILLSKCHIMSMVPLYIQRLYFILPNYLLIWLVEQKMRKHWLSLATCSPNSASILRGWRAHQPSWWGSWVRLIAILLTVVAGS